MWRVAHQKSDALRLKDRKAFHAETRATRRAFKRFSAAKWWQKAEDQNQDNPKRTRSNFKRVNYQTRKHAKF